MARMPIEVVAIAPQWPNVVKETIQLANSVQGEFVFSGLVSEDEQKFQMRAFNYIKAKEFLDSVEQIRQVMKGYHPFIISIVNADVDGERFTNLFGSHRASNGIALFTTRNVIGVIIPENKIHCYILYYLARYALSFVVPTHKNHDETRDCAFDRKITKTDLLRSMKGQPFCDECRAALVEDPYNMSASQFNALNTLFDITSTLLEKGYKFAENPLRNTSASIQEVKEDTQSTVIISSSVAPDILEAKRRRLNALKLKQARYGYEAPVHIITEIEDLEREMKLLK